MLLSTPGCVRMCAEQRGVCVHKCPSKHMAEEPMLGVESEL